MDSKEIMRLQMAVKGLSTSRLGYCTASNSGGGRLLNIVTKIAKHNGELVAWLDNGDYAILRACKGDEFCMVAPILDMKLPEMEMHGNGKTKQQHATDAQRVS